MKTATLALKERALAETAAVPNFNRLASSYRWMEWVTFGPFLSKCRLAFLSEMRNSRSALVIGDGDGRFAARLLQHNPLVMVDAVDASHAMLRELVRGAGLNAARVRAHAADARQFNFAEVCPDLVATHFFLDCLTTAEVESLAKKLRG